jgi:hypothetical protein
MDSKIQEALDKLRNAALHYDDVRRDIGRMPNPVSEAAEAMRDAAWTLDEMVQTGGVIANVIVFVFTYADGTTERMVYMAEDGLMKGSERAIAAASLRESVHGHVTYWAHGPGTVTW